MKKVLSATFLVILVTLECRGDRSTPGDVTSWVRPTQAPTTVAAFVVRFPSKDEMSPSYQAPDARISQNEGLQPRNVTTRRPTCNCKHSVEPSPGLQPHTTLPPVYAEITSYNEPVADAADVINNQLRQFGLDLLIQLSQIDSESNLVLSPFSIWSVLLLILEGARNTTAEQIRTTLHLPRDAAQIRSNFKFIESGLLNVSGSAIFDTVSALFFDVNRPLNFEYETKVQAYHAEVHGINFSSPDATVWTVNRWVANKTHNRITRLIHKGDLIQPELLVTNAIYFKGLWETPFNLTATKKAKFYNEENVHIADVDMMYQKGVYLYSFIREINSHVLDMPYKDHSFRMLLILPQQGNTLLNMYRDMKRFPVNECYNRLLEEQEMYSDAEIPVYLPRFKVKNDRTINRILQNLGVQNLFNPDAADLTGMTQSKVYLNKMIHIAEIEVNERGTIASGATGAMFGNKQQPPKFVGNRPFAFFIVENTRKTVIFAGRVLNPNKVD